MGRKPPLQPPRKFDDDDDESYEAPAEVAQPQDDLVTVQLRELVQQEVRRRGAEIERSVERRLDGFRDEMLDRCRAIATEVARDESTAILGRVERPSVAVETDMTGSRLLLGFLAVGLAAAGVAAIKSIGSEPGFPGLEKYTQG